MNSHRTTTVRPSSPLVLVDIDGVLNAFASGGVGEHQRVARAGGYRVVLDRRHPGWFDVLADHAELWWATMWQAHAGPVFGAVAGLGHDWPHLDFDGAYVGANPSAQRTGHGVGGYKWPRILEMGETRRPMVWIDDDMDDDHLAWAAERDGAGCPTLFIRPDPAEGFTFDQFLDVLAFVRRSACAKRHDDPGSTEAAGVLDPPGTLHLDRKTTTDTRRRTA